MHFFRLRRGRAPLRRLPLMLATMTALLSCLAIDPPDMAAADELRTYEGQLRATMGEADQAPIRFTLTLLVGQDTNPQGYWTLKQAGQRGWEWVDRIGRIEAAAGSEPALRYDDGQVHGTVPILLAVAAPPQGWSAGARWDVEQLHHEVVAVEGGTTGQVRVQVRSDFGDKRAVTVDAASGLVRDAREIVFLGQGERFVLEYQLAEQRSLTGEDAEQAAAAFRTISDLRDKLQLSPWQAPRQWTDAQLEQVRDILPPIAEQTQVAAVAELAKSALEEAQSEHNRAGALEALRRKALEGQLPEFQFEIVAGKALSRQDLNNSVTVIHFWEYQDAPLREPYGQVGYLDYLYRKYEQQGLRVIGVVVNQQTESTQQRRSGVLSARRFANFMNLAYPLYVDDGALLKSLGDPRLAEAALPLFVVIDPQGKVIHYYSGLYPVDKNRGLAELEGVVTQALQTVE